METSLNGLRIVLIGGAGFIGHNLALSLKREGAEVSVVDSLQVNNFLSFLEDNDGKPHQGFYRRILSRRLDLLREAEIPLYAIDARDYHAVSRVLTERNAQVVIHLAAVAHANRSNKNPFSTFDHSLRTLENALDAARSRVEHFIFFSSSMVYGNFKEHFVREENQCEPLGIYGALKLAGEKIVIAYNQVFDLPYTIVRPSALYGQRCVSGRVGQKFIENAIRGGEIRIDGDGSDRLDFTYINDLVTGVKQIIRRDEAKGEIFNLTYGESRTIAEMAEILRNHFPDIDVHYKQRDALTPARGTLCVDKARELLGYNPAFPLEHGYVEYIDWYKSEFSRVVDLDIVQLEAAPL